MKQVIAPPKGFSAQDFERIEAAVMETERGRWFLQEYARRRRAEGTDEILDAMARLHATVAAREETEAAREAAELRLRREAARAAYAVGEAMKLLQALAYGGEGAETADGYVETDDDSGALERRLNALQELDDLPAEEKLRLFG